ncbi:hypothetical protein [Nostoc sp. GT001]|uniref:hypothetical protein n=1 Tax=Nostoc sp. GT001 TaxID=3056647 RepID=UPI0025AB2400|nr:hypothetical protein [Nostoc sp. GT001]MDM9584813.1 hypothetical protein [Nostoc sp. GT001]
MSHKAIRLGEAKRNPTKLWKCWVSFLNPTYTTTTQLKVFERSHHRCFSDKRCDYSKVLQ